MKKLLFTLLITVIVSQPAWSQFAGGDGSADNPYQVETMEHLMNVTGGDHYLQMNDLDAEGVEFSPLGHLTGSYNGNGYIISNITIDTEDNLHVGLFNVIAGGEIRNIGLENLELIAPSGEMVGGITGMLTAGGTIENVFVTGYVDGWLMASGIVGHVVDGVVNNSYAHVTVDANDTQNAGVAGRLSGNGEVHNSYAVAQVTGGDWFGVVVGNNDGGTVTNIYWDTEQSSPALGIGHGDEGTNVNGLTTAQMTGSAAAENMDALDFESIWATTEDDYPVLLWQVDESIRVPDNPGLLQTLPYEFNIDTEEINWDRYTFFPFDGANLTRISNPDQSAGNDTEYVLEYEKRDGGQPWAGFFYKVEPLNLTEESTFSMKVWSPRQDIEAIMKLEQLGGSGDTGDLIADVTVSGEWTTLEWDLSEQSRDIPWNLITIIMDLDGDNPPEGGSDHTWYVDDFALENIESASLSLSSFDLLTPADDSTIVVEGRASQQVVFEWEATENVFDADLEYYLHLDGDGGNFSDPLMTELSDNNGTATTFTTNFEALDTFLDDQGYDVGDLATLSWTVTAQLNGDEVVRFADSEFTIQLDRGEVQLGIVAPDNFADLQPLPWEFNMDTNLIDWDDYTFNPFDGAVLDRIENPDPSGINQTQYVLEYEKALDGQPWAGFEYLLEEDFQITDQSIFRLKVWSPRQDIEAIMKLELVDEEGSIEESTGDQFTDITVSEEWTTLEWDLSGLNKDIEWNRMVIIMDLDIDNPPAGGADNTWYLDEFQLIQETMFAGGSGTMEDPYQIETMAHLMNVTGGNHYIQMNDLDAEGVEFSPLGHLTGSYNGNGSVIYNLTIDTEDDLHVGLFSVIPGGELRNLGLDNLNLLAPSGEMVGGITGMLTAGGTVENVFVTGYIDGWLMASGIVGHVVDGVVNNSYAHVSVDANDTQNAGVAGRLSGNGEVHNSYAVAQVTGGDWFGVVIGNNDGGTVTNIYWDTEQSVPAAGIGHGDEGTNVNGLTTVQMIGSAAADNMDALDFDETWQTVDGAYPILSWQDPGTAVIPTSTEGPGEELPIAFELQQNYPNPFNPTTKISFSLPEQSNVTLSVYDLLGRRVATLVDERRAAGTYTVDFDASRLASGVYLYHLQADGFVETKKMMLVK